MLFTCSILESVAVCALIALLWACAAEAVGKEISASAAKSVVDEVGGVTCGADGSAGRAMGSEIAARNALEIIEIVILIDTREAVIVGIASQAMSVV